MSQNLNNQWRAAWRARDYLPKVQAMSIGRPFAREAAALTLSVPVTSAAISK
jgi:hypothetical protein